MCSAVSSQAGKGSKPWSMPALPPSLFLLRLKEGKHGSEQSSQDMPENTGWAASGPCRPAADSRKHFSASGKEATASALASVQALCYDLQSWCPIYSSAPSTWPLNHALLHPHRCPLIPSLWVGSVGGLSSKAACERSRQRPRRSLTGLCSGTNFPNAKRR